MSTYIKKYDVGTITIDLPYNSYIHNLPLLSFNDFRDSVNISLVFNQKLKIDEDNSFNIGKGYKLNIHKKIIFQNNIPIKLMESNGKYVLLNRNKNSLNENSTIYNNVYTFDDESKRILRVKTRLNTQTNIDETYYEVENDDLSKEIYNSLGYLHYIYDKYDDVYLEYHYENNLLKWVKYANNDNYKITFIYNNNQLISICYGGTTTTLVYENPNLTINHYSGVIYNITITDSKYTIECRGSESTELYYKTKECTYSGRNIVLTYKEGTTEIDRLQYTFPSSVTNGYRMYDYVYITNKNNVKERIQFNGEKPLYSYEVDYDYNEVKFNNDICSSDVTIHNTLNTPQANLYKGIIKYNSGISMIRIPQYLNKWGCQGQTEEGITSTYLITGWAKSSVATGNNEIKVGYGTENNELIYKFNIKINEINQWHFFAYQFDINSKNIVLSSTNNLDVKDLRIMFRATDINQNKKNIFLTLQEDILIDNSTNQSVLFKNIIFEYVTEGNDSGEIKLTYSDVLRYMKKKIRLGYCNEIYYENCKKVITDLLSLKIYINGSSSFKYINDYGVGYLQYRNGKEYETRVQNYNSSTTPLIISNNKDKSYYSYQYINPYFDIKDEYKDGIYTYYERDKGLVTQEIVQDSSYNTISKIKYIYNTVSSTIIVKDEASSSNSYLYSGITYYMDPIWGVITKTKTNDKIEEDTYDDDKSVILEKEFKTSTTSGIKHLYGYNKGNLTSLSCDTLNYTFSYNKDKISQITKSSTSIEECVHTDSSLTIYYPNQSNSVYNKQYIYDKYDRTKSITNVLENTYNAFSIFNESTGEPNKDYDTNNSKLVMYEDKTRNQKHRFYYNPEGTLSKVEVSKSSNYLDKISEETFTYDEANRILSKEYTHNILLNEKVKDEFTYVKEEDNPYIDEVIKTSKYLINDNEIVSSINSYLNKKLETKTHKFNNKIITKEFEYNYNKIQSETSNISGTTSLKTYEYDRFDRISSITSNGKKITYEYDNYNRLIRENNEQLDKTIIYSYNNIGNIVSNKTYGYTESVNPTTLQETKTYTYDSSIKDRLVSFNGTTIPYNTLGLITMYNGYNLTWTKGKLTGMSKGTLELGNESYSYTYNGYGQRVSKTYIKTQGTGTIGPIYIGEVIGINKQYYYDKLGRLIRESNTYDYQGGNSSNEIIEYLYDANTIIGIKYTKGTTSNIYYFDRNILGDVIGIYDTNGVLKVKYLYDAYGNCTVSNETTDTSLAKANPIRYRGYYYDEETQLYWVSSRYYSPEFCRFISPDDVDYLDPESVNGLNLYCYCGNDPVNRYDVNGHFWDYVLDAVFIVAGAYDFIKDPSWSKGLWLAADVVLAVLPFIPAISSARHLGKIDNVIDAASALNKIDNVGDVASDFRYADDVIDSGQEIGTYLLKNVDGDVIYVGKGSRNRMIKNFNKFNADSFLYYPAKNIDMAFANEAYFVGIYGGAQSMMKNYRLLGGYQNASRLLNKINSHGLKYLFYWF